MILLLKVTWLRRDSQSEGVIDQSRSSARSRSNYHIPASVPDYFHFTVHHVMFIMSFNSCHMIHMSSFVSAVSWHASHNGIFVMGTTDILLVSFMRNMTPGCKRVSRGGGPKGPGPPRNYKAKKKRSSEQILSYFTYILLLFLVENIPHFLFVEPFLPFMGRFSPRGGPFFCFWGHSCWSIC